MSSASTTWTSGGLDTPPVTELVGLPDGRSVRTMAANEALKAKVDALQRKRAEFFKLDIGEGVHVDGWRILPPDFDRAWRKSIYRQIGILASRDQAAAVRAALTAWPFIDAERVGVWGWSGGGSMTLTAMVWYPHLYKTGLSLAWGPD